MNITYRIPLWVKYEYEREEQVTKEHYEIVTEWKAKIGIMRILRLMNVISCEIEYDMIWGKISADMVQRSRGSEHIVTQLILNELHNEG